MSATQEAQRWFISQFFFGFLINELDEYTQRNNPEFNPDSAVQQTFVIMHNIPSYLSAFSFALGFTRIRDIFLVLFWLGQIGNNLVNRVLANYIVAIRNNPPLIGSFTYDTPSFVVQLAFFFYTTIAVFPLLYRRYSEPSFVVFLYVLALLVPAAQMGLLYDAPINVLLTSLLGMGLAVLFHAILVAVVYPWGRAWVRSVQAWCATTEYKSAAYAMGLLYTPDTWTEPKGVWVIIDELHGVKSEDRWYTPRACVKTKLRANDALFDAFAAKQFT